MGIYNRQRLGSFLQDISYSYNERGLTNQTSAKFSLQLAYNNGITTGAMPQYNGNIAEMYSTSEHTGTGNRMKYSYDPLNRLVAADHNSNELTENGISYDQMGNILTLNRSRNGTEQLSYSYAGNQLQTVLRNNSPFKRYSYGANGNATSDGEHKAIRYNMLNLPQSVTNTQSNTTIATYTYSASGTKLRNTGSDGIWDYDNGIVYNNGVIKFIATEEGRVIPNGGSYSYRYNLKDHLGNSRVSMDNTGVLQEDEYYAFGFRHGRYDASNNNRYLYNGKEIQSDLDNQYD